MANNNLIYLDDKNPQTFKVIIEGDNITVDSEDVEAIAFKSREKNCEDIAKIIAYIEFHRNSRNAIKSERKVKPLNNQLVALQLVEIFKRYSAEEFVEIIKELKWPEIEVIFKASNPVQVIEEII